MSKRQACRDVKQHFERPKTKAEKALYKKELQKQARHRNYQWESSASEIDNENDDEDSESSSSESNDDDDMEETSEGGSRSSGSDDDGWCKRGKDGELQGPLKKLPTPATSDPANPPIDILIKALQRWSKDPLMTTKEKAKAVKSIYAIWHPDKNPGRRQPMCTSVFQAMQREVQRLLEMRRRLKERHEQIQKEREMKRETKQVFKKQRNGKEDPDWVDMDIDIEQHTGPIENADRPLPRSHFCMCNANDTLHIFGGEWFDGKTYNTYGELFTFNDAQRNWTQLYESAPGIQGPSSRSGFVMSHIGDSLYVFGGEHTSKDQRRFRQFNDLWRYNIPSSSSTQNAPTTASPDSLEGKWELIQAKDGPNARSGHRGCSIGHMFLIFGGFHERAGNFNAQYSNDLYAFDTKENVWRKQKGGKAKGAKPEPRAGGCMWAGNQCCYIYGGTRPGKNQKLHTFDDLWKCTEDGWQGPFTTQGPKRQGMSVASLSANKAVFYGGVTESGDETTYHRDLIVLDIFEQDMQRCTWTQVPISRNSPCGRFAAQIAVKDNGLCVFGGACTFEDEERTLDDLWRYDFNTGVWHNLVPMSDRAGEWFEELHEEEEPPAPIPSLGCSTISLVCDIDPSTLSKKERAKWEKRKRQEVKKVKMDEKNQKKLNKKGAKLEKKQNMND